jgi:hypothetical protein
MAWSGQVLGRLNTEGFETWRVQGWKKNLRAGEIPIKYKPWNRLVLNRDGSQWLASPGRGPGYPALEERDEHERRSAPGPCRGPLEPAVFKGRPLAC